MTLSSHNGNVPQSLPHGSLPRPPMRASDTDREAVVQLLCDATTLGMLTQDECSERVAAAYSTRFQNDLAPLTADLPPATAATTAPTTATAPGWRALTMLTLLQVRTSLAAIPGIGVPRPQHGLVVVLFLLVMLPSLGVLALVGVLEAGDLLGLELLDG